NLVARHRPVYRSGSERYRTEGPAPGGKRAVCRGGGGCRRFAGGRMAGDPTEAGQSLVLVRLARLRVRRPGSRLADSAFCRTHFLVVADVEGDEARAASARRELFTPDAVSDFKHRYSAVLCGGIDVWARQRAD